MRELAALLFLLLPNWNVLDDLKQNLEDVYRPQKTAVVEEIKLENFMAGPTKMTSDNYQTSARALYSIDYETNTELVSTNADEELPIASLTKLMSTYVILKNTTNLDEVIVVPNYSLQAGDAVVGVGAGESFTKRELLQAVLISSGSDATQALAINLFGSNEAFVAKMNEYANKLYLTNSHFSNPVGWDDPNNYSSPRDIANLSRILLRNDFFKETVNTKSLVITSETGRQITLNTTNQLLGVNGFSGIKTGYTEGAGGCLASLETVEGHTILTVVLGTADRFGETRNANTWTRQHFLW